MKAQIHSDYVTIFPGDDRLESSGVELPFLMPRGLDVRLSEILWCADAPTGS